MPPAFCFCLRQRGPAAQNRLEGLTALRASADAKPALCGKISSVRVQFCPSVASSRGIRSGSNAIAVNTITDYLHERLNLCSMPARRHSTGGERLCTEGAFCAAGSRIFARGNVFHLDGEDSFRCGPILTPSTAFCAKRSCPRACFALQAILSRALDGVCVGESRARSHSALTARTPAAREVPLPLRVAPHGGKTDEWPCPRPAVC